MTQRDGKVQRVRVPGLTDREGWKGERVYLRGDVVTYDRSLFIARTDHPNGRPGATSDWRLAVQRGKDGKDSVTRSSVTPG